MESFQDEIHSCTALITCTILARTSADDLAGSATACNNEPFGRLWLQVGCALKFEYDGYAHRQGSTVNILEGWKCDNLPKRTVPHCGDRVTKHWSLLESSGSYTQSLILHPTLCASQTEICVRSASCICTENGDNRGVQAPSIQHVDR